MSAMQPNAGMYRLSATESNASWIIEIHADGTAEVMGGRECVWVDPPGHYEVADMKVDIAFHGNDPAAESGEGTGTTNEGTPDEHTWPFTWTRLSASGP